MTPFEHLSVLISIILGLGIAHLLASVHKVVQAGTRVRHYWLPVLWTVLIFIAQVEWWWASFELRDHADWNFFYFLFMLMSPVALYLASAFVLPDIEGSGDYDMEEYYFQTRGWLFTVLASSNLFDAIRRGIEAGTVYNSGVIGNLVSVVLVLSLGVSRNRWHHAVITVAVAGLFLSFIITEAIKLSG